LIFSIAPSVSPGCIVWNKLFSKCKLYKNTNIYHVTFKEEFEDISVILRRFVLLVDNKYRPVKLITFINLIIRLHFITVLTLWYFFFHFI
jgi:hypothetical protein